MVKLTKIYTRTGDDGTTGLGDGSRVSKHALRVEAYGTVDEANALVGMAVVAAEACPHEPRTRRIAEILRSVQHDLFDVGADLCIPIDPAEKPGAMLRVRPEQTDRLEPMIDEFNDHMSSLRSFVLPGGTPLAAALHVARTVTRRAERLCVALHEAEPRATGIETIRFLNRLSDLLFVLGRAANDMGRGDVLWLPGKNRGEPGAQDAS